MQVYKTADATASTSLLINQSKQESDESKQALVPSATMTAVLITMMAVLFAAVYKRSRKTHADDDYVRSSKLEELAN